jgi:hypothetical protein
MTDSGLEGFELFDQRFMPMADPMVTMQSNGNISLNAAAQQGLGGNPEGTIHVELLYSAERNTIALRPTTPERAHLAYPVRRQGSGPGPGSFIVNAASFVRHYGLGQGKALRYPARISDGILYVDLNAEPAVIHARRTKKGGPNEAGTHRTQGARVLRGGGGR